MHALGHRVVRWLARDAWLPAVALALSLLLLVFFLVARDLPLVDLPQHAAQIATWQRWDSHEPAVVQRFELNFRTPYLLAYPLARLLAPWLGAVVALKLVVWLAIVGNAWALTRLARRLGHDPWLGLLGLVTAAGLCFYFGFISFMLAIPLAVWALAVALDHAERPTWSRGALLALLLCLMLSAHGVAFVMGFGCVGLLLLRGGGTFVARVAPLLAPVALAAVWILPGPVGARIGGDSWDLTPLRLVELPALLVGMGAADHFAVTLGLVLLGVAVAAAGTRVTRVPERVLPLLFLLAGYAFFPAMFRGIVLLHTRLPCFLLPLLLIALEPADVKRVLRPRDVRLGMLAATLVWFAVFGTRLAAFNREASAFHELEARLPAGLAMRPLVFDRNTSVFPGVPAYLHYSAYYYVEKGGTQGYSFAMYPISVVRLRPETRATMQGGAEWRPDLFRRDEIDDYDYFLVRSESDRGDELFAGTPVVLDAHVGSWWGYTNGERARAVASRTRAVASRARPF